MKKIMLIGANGFLGRHVLNCLTMRDDVEVFILSRNAQRNSLDNPKIKAITGDLGDRESLSEIVPGPEGVLINLAYDPKDHARNIQYAQNLKHHIQKKCPGRVILVSTAVVAGRVKDPVINEQSTCRPHTIYEKTKLEIEQIFTKDMPAEVEVVILRPTAIVGPGGLNLVKLLESLVRNSLFLNNLKSFILGKRCMNLVSVYYVASVVNYFVDGYIYSKRETIIVAEDDVPLNNFSAIDNYFRKKLRMPLSSPVHLPSLVFSLLLLAINRTSAVPYLRYDARKLASYGIHRTDNLCMAIDDFFNNWININENSQR